MKIGEEYIVIDSKGIKWSMIDLGEPKICVLGMSDDEFEHYKKQDFNPYPIFIKQK